MALVYNKSQHDMIWYEVVGPASKNSFMGRGPPYLKYSARDVHCVDQDIPGTFVSGMWLHYTISMLLTPRPDCC